MYAFMHHPGTGHQYKSYKKEETRNYSSGLYLHIYDHCLRLFRCITPGQSPYLVKLTPVLNPSRLVFWASMRAVFCNGFSDIFLGFLELQKMLLDSIFSFMCRCDTPQDLCIL